MSGLWRDPNSWYHSTRSSVLRQLFSDLTAIPPLFRISPCVCFPNSTDTGCQCKCSDQNWPKSCYGKLMSWVRSPSMDGFESTKLIRKLEMEEHRQPCYIVGFTASTASRAHDDCIAAGMQMVVTKPCSGKKLLAAVERFL